MLSARFFLSMFILFLFSCNENATEVIEEVETILIDNIEQVITMPNSEITLRDNIVYLNDQAYTGALNQKWSNGKLKLAEQYLEGKKHGYAKKSFENGSLQSHYNYVNGKEHGLQIGNHFSGKLSYRYHCLNGERVGWYFEYFPDGNLQIKNYYHFGKIVKSRVQSPDGKVMVNYEIKDGRYYGLLGSSQCVSIIDNKPDIEREK